MCSTLLIIRETQVKTAMRYHRIPVSMAIISKSTNNKSWRGCGDKRIPPTLEAMCWQQCVFTFSVSMGPTYDCQHVCFIARVLFSGCQSPLACVQDIPEVLGINAPQVQGSIMIDKLGRKQPISLSLYTSSGRSPLGETQWNWLDNRPFIGCLVFPCLTSLLFCGCFQRLLLK